MTSDSIIQSSDFTLIASGTEMGIESVRISESDSRVLILIPSGPIFFNRVYRISYSGANILHTDQVLMPFENIPVNKNLARHFQLPVKIQAEDFYWNNGLVLENCSDVSGGKNTGYADVGDYVD